MSIVMRNRFLCFCIAFSVCVAFSTPTIAEEEMVPGVVIKMKHKVAKKGDVLVVHVLANDIGSDDPRPVALWLSDDQTLEHGDRFLAEDTISDYERGPDMIGMPVLTKLKVKQLKELEGKFAIITIGTAREVFQTGDQSLVLVQKIGRPECVSDLFLREDEPNDEEGVAVRAGKLKQHYCASLLGEIEATGTEEVRADIDRYRFFVKESLVFDSTLTHGKDLDFDLMFVAVEDWLNEGRDIPGSIAQICIIDWFIKNRTARKEWRVRDTVIMPESVQCPVMIVASKRDRLVTYESATCALSDFPNAHHVAPDCGHIGMMVGRHAKGQVWQKFADWVLDQKL